MMINDARQSMIFSFEMLKVIHLRLSLASEAFWHECIQILKVEKSQ
jgi:hypothetical protein